MREPSSDDAAALATEAGDPARRFHTFDSFYTYPAFRYVWASNFLFFTGIWTQTLVLGWLAYALTESTFLLGLFTAARLSPMLLGPIGGAIADRVDRVSFLLVTQSITLAAATTIAVLASLGAIEYWHLLVTGALVGLGQSPSQPARFTLVMDIVGRDGVMNANALNAVALNSTMVIGPAIGGVLVAGIGETASLWLIVSWYLLATLALVLLRRRYGSISRPRSAATEGVLGGVVGAMRIAWTDRRVRTVLLVTLGANMCVWPVQQGFLPVFAEEVFDVGVRGLSAMMATTGIGMLSGSLTLASLTNVPRKGTVYAVGTAVFGLGFALFALAPSFPLALAILFIAGMGAAGFMVMQSTLMLLVATEETRGRMMGMQVLAIGVMPIATLTHGVLATQYGVVTTTVVAGSLLGLAMAWLLATQSWFRRLG